MIAAPSAPVRPPMPRVPVPIDELLKLAREFLDAGRLVEAERLLDHILTTVRDAPAALHLKGIVLFRAGRPEAAAEAMERAVELAPGAMMIRRDLCPVYERLGRYKDALRIGQQPLAMERYDLQTLHNRALVHYRRLELDECVACARRALALDPTAAGAHFQLAEALLLRGEFAEGLNEYEWRYRIAGARPPLPWKDRRQWDGSPRPGDTLLLVADQGFGDVIQFCRFIPWVCGICSDVVVMADAAMRPLIRQSHPAVRLISNWSECTPFEVYCPLSGLPRLHGITLETIRCKIPYLAADSARLAAWCARLDALLPHGLRRVGIAWAGRPTHNNDFNRSMTLSAFGPIAALDDIALVSLQKGPAQRAIADYLDRAPLLNLGPALGDFLDTMAVIEMLDLVVTVDTSVAHLAGAMGKPVWILLPYAPDWRWLLDREDSPWYPTARLFRQSSPGDWSGVVRRVAEALRQG